MEDLVDDKRLTRTKELKQTILTLQKIRHCMARLIASWDSFESQDVKNFALEHADGRREVWEEYLTGIRAHIRELQFSEILLQQKLELFKGMGVFVSLSILLYNANLTHTSR